MTIEQLQIVLRQFAEERDWDEFHSPKNLAMALACEVGELLEHFQWLTEEKSKKLRLLPYQDRLEINLEMADVMIYLVMLADRLDVDLLKACKTKIELNAEKYPV